MVVAVNKVSATEVLLPGAISIVIATLAGASIKGVAVLKAKSSNKISPLRYTSTVEAAKSGEL